ncbi:uncharacterized protein LOC131590004 [Poecile atricapillus]|uniref:uncharacterized protein LOC131590004 n=1 Tax=Poecile atricapillus TaxID=48891 RepID=UPI00273996B3|nr:uncharacterized protein LOC131590004 [Poecile atricapillus]
MTAKGIPENIPLGCLLKRWKSEGFFQEMSKDKMIDYCNHWWPEYKREGPSWPENGTVDFDTINSLMRYLEASEKWDEIQYLDLFHLLRRKKEWQTECGIMVLEMKESECGGEKCCKKESKCVRCLALKSRTEEDLSLLVSPGAPSTAPLPSASPLPTASPLPSASLHPSLYPPLPESSSEEEDGEDEEATNITVAPGNAKKVAIRLPIPSPRNTPLAARTRQGRKNHGGPQLIAPLREAVGPQKEKVVVKVPFSPGDLVIWKQSAGNYRENPERVARVVKMIVRTQNPDWNDMQVLLDTLMDSTEKEMVLRAMKERAREMIRLYRVGETVNDLVPSDDPGWDPDKAEGMESIRAYQELLVEGIRTGMPKTLNWSKLYSVKQDKNESPSAFLERLKETASRFTDLEIDSEAGKLQLALIFLGQAQEDIRKKLQKLEGQDTRDLDKILEVAWKVYNNREKETAKKQQANLLAIMQQAEQDLKVRIDIDGKEQEFIVDTGATHSVLNKRLGPISDTTIQVVGATGQLEERPFLQPLNLRFGGKELDHQFLYMPNCPKPLLGRDLLSSLNVRIIFENGRVKLEVPGEEIAKLFVIKEIDPSPIPIEVDHAVVPWVWESGNPEKSKAAHTVVVELKEGAQPVRIKQYPIKLEAKQGVAPLITQFLAQGILQECESDFNTPIFPVRKPNGKYRLVQDLRAINNIVKDIHPVVANPYTLLTSVSEKFKWFSVIDLKDAFFCIPLALESRKYFAFEWENPDTGRKRQLTWSRLPQGFKNSPTIFGNQLAKELEEWKTAEVRELPSSYVVLQYVDDIFLATAEKGLCLKLTIALLNMLGQAGYRVSKEKAQLIKESVIYLGCEITQGQRRLGVNRVEAICAIPLPRNHQELRSFLGMVGWCRLWILNFGLLAKPLYEALKEPQLSWDRQRKKAFEDLKQALREAPALGLPDLNKDFLLYVNERQKLALGVLAQRLGSWKRPVGYFSKQLDTVSAGWPSCLRAVTATVILIQEARKLTLGRKIEVFVPHMVLAVLEQKGGHWLSSSRMLQYQAILREQDDVDLKMTNHVNPAEFLRSEQEEGELAHDCMEVIEQVYASRMDLKDVPMEDPDWELFTDGSSYVENGTRYAGYAVVTVTTVVEAKALVPGTSAQRAEIIGLTRALILSSGKKVNIWTDSKYAFGVVHIHGALWKERGLLNSQGTTIK